MRICRLDSPIPDDLKGAVVALGNFDGVHLGHRAVLGEARRCADAAGRRLGVMVFEPHPRRVFRPDDPPFQLTSLNAKARLLSALGVDVLFVLPFDRARSLTPAESFVRDILVGAFGVGEVVCGQGFMFGHQRGGDVALLSAMGESLGFGVHEVAPVSDDGGVRFSSSRAREALSAADLDTAKAILGRRWAIDGLVEAGDRRGRTIGFPTANVALGDYLVPKRGVYAVRACVEGPDGDGAWQGGAANVGVRPTVDGSRDSLEVHLLDFDGDLYGSVLRVVFVAWLRGEQRFDGLDALKRQIAADCAAARESLAAADA
jgi:riboflavin kinase/FMN adenylyltransferase